MNNELLPNKDNDEQYDPFANPPNFEKAQRHRLANAVGHDKEHSQQNESDNLCPCCQKEVQKTPIKLCCQDQQLLFMGIGYPLLYKLFRYFSLIILIVFVISGGFFYFMVTIKCQHKCWTFMGVPIINLDMSNQEQLHATEVSNVITALGIFAAVLYFKSVIMGQIATLQKQIICPSHYSVMLQNLPDQLSHTQLNNWIKQKFDATPVKINLAYDVNQLQNAYKKKQSLTIALNTIQIKYNFMRPEDRDLDIRKKIQYHKIEISKLDRILNYYRQMSIECKTIGTAFITFESVKTVNKILDNHQTSFTKSLVNSMLSVINRQPLSFKNKNVLIFRAPAPQEIIWENLEFSYFKRIGLQFTFIAVMVFLIFVAFRVQFYFVRYAYELRTEGATSGQVIVMFQALVMSIIVVVLNSLLRLVILGFARLKRHYSYTRLQSSFCGYYSLLYILNSCFMIYIVHGKQIEDSDGLLLYDIHLIMLANAFSQPLFKLFDPLMWGRIALKAYVKNLPPQKNPYTQEYVNQLWEGYSISNGDNYQYVTRVLFITIWFAHSAPLGVFFSLAGMLTDYWVGKYLLLRVYKKPEHISKQIAKPILMSLQLLPLVYICGVLQFTYKLASSDNIFKFFSQFLGYGITIFILCVSLLGYLIYYRPNKNYVTQEEYSKMQFIFDSNYETQNPMTKYQGELNYLNSLLKKSSDREQTKRIKSIVQDAGREFSSIFLRKRSEIYRVKRKVIKKMTNSRLNADVQMTNFKRLSQSVTDKKHQLSSGSIGGKLKSVN